MLKVIIYIYIYIFIENKNANYAYKRDLLVAEPWVMLFVIIYYTVIYKLSSDNVG